jgi:CBS domain-containing protein
MDLTQLDQPQAQDRIERSLMEDTVSRLRPHLPFTVLPTTTVGQAIGTMLAHNIGALLVVNESSHLLGIFSERDLLTKVAGRRESFAQLPIQEFMTPNPETVTAKDTVAFALHKMDVGGYRHLPVLDGSKPVGVISVRDLLRYMTRICQDFPANRNEA